MRIQFLAWLLISILLLSSCTIEVNQSTAMAPVPTVESIPTAVPSPENTPQTNIVTTTQIPVTWAPLNLMGKLVYINGIVADNVFRLQIQVLNLVTGEVTTIFDSPKYSWIYYVTVSPDYTQLVMSYSPPPEGGPLDQNLYIMPLDGSQPPKLLFTPPALEDDYIEVEWSPDGKYIYYTHVNYQIPPEEGQVYPLYEIYRMAFPDGHPEKIADKAYWPRISPDSSHIAYVSVDLFKRGNKLVVADADGENAHEVVITGPRLPEIVDAPIFSPDGQSIFFSSDIPIQSYQPNWFEKLMGIRVAKAHGNIPSDWWSVPVNGGQITRLTNIQSLALFASFASDGQHIASYSANGIFVMKPGGSEITMLIPNPQSIPGTVSWIP
jgi:hypothetical protein